MTASSTAVSSQFSLATPGASIHDNAGIIAVVAFWRIFTKAGFPGWYGLGVVIPMVNILLVLFLAFAEWPLERKLSGLRPSSDRV